MGGVGQTVSSTSGLQRYDVYGICLVAALLRALWFACGSLVCRVSELYHHRNDLLEELMDADAAAAKGKGPAITHSSNNPSKLQLTAICCWA